MRRSAPATTIEGETVRIVGRATAWNFPGTSTKSAPLTATSTLISPAVSNNGLTHVIDDADTRDASTVIPAKRQIAVS